jgi:RNA polymerase sigma-70 factor (ECF subfamily)
MAIASDVEIRAELGRQLPRLWRYGLVLSRQRHVADDLVQATCVRALERAGQFVPGTRLDRWLLAILHSIWLNEVRSQRVRQGQGFVDAESELSFDGESQAQGQVLAAQVIKRVNALPDAQRETVFLAYVEGLSYREIAEILHIPVGTVMSRLAAARLRLAETAAPQATSETSKGERR